jgi:hypothetical protein
MSKSRTTDEYLVLLALSCMLFVLYLINGLVFLYLILILVAPSLVIPFIRKWVVKGFESLTGLIGKAINFVLLALLYYLLLFPLSLLKKLSGKTAVGFSKRKVATSYFVEAKEHFTKEEFEKLW